MSKKIQNPAIPIPDTSNMTDRDFITDMLTTEKYITVSYAIAEHEASHTSLYETIHQISNESNQMQRRLYECMFQKGLYPLEAADTSKIQESYTQHVGYESQFPYGQGN
ncbi:spore coat protein [Bacillus sp. FSL W7-1360]